MYLWSGERIFFSRLSSICWLLFGVRSIPVLPQWHVKDPGNSTKTRIRPWPNEVGVSWLCLYPGIVWEPILKRAHTQLFREHSATVVSARWVSVDWSWPTEWNLRAQANLHFEKKKKKSAGGEWMVEHSPKILASVRGKSHQKPPLPPPVVAVVAMVVVVVVVV